MESTYFVARNTSNDYYLKETNQISDPGNRPKFQANGSLVKFDSVFSAVEFFEGSRFDTSAIEIVKILASESDSWSFESASNLKKHLTGK
jgi:hypothetical protein